MTLVGSNSSKEQIALTLILKAWTRNNTPVVGMFVACAVSKVFMLQCSVLICGLHSRVRPARACQFIHVTTDLGAMTLSLEILNKICDTYYVRSIDVT